MKISITFANILGSSKILLFSLNLYLTTIILILNVSAIETGELVEEEELYKQCKGVYSARRINRDRSKTTDTYARDLAKLYTNQADTRPTHEDEAEEVVYGPEDAVYGHDDELFCSNGPSQPAVEPNKASVYQYKDSAFCSGYGERV